MHQPARQQPKSRKREKQRLLWELMQYQRRRPLFPEPPSQGWKREG